PRADPPPTARTYSEAKRGTATWVVPQRRFVQYRRAAAAYLVCERSRANAGANRRILDVPVHPSGAAAALPALAHDLEHLGAAGDLRRREARPGRYPRRRSASRPNGRGEGRYPPARHRAPAPLAGGPGPALPTRRRSLRADPPGPLPHQRRGRLGALARALGGWAA